VGTRYFSSDLKYSPDVISNISLTRQDGKIRRLTIFTYHPSYVRQKQKQPEIAIAVDEACNLAAEIVGLDCIQQDFLVKNRFSLNTMRV